MHRKMKTDLKNIEFDSNYPSVSDLRKRAAGRIPGFAFDYLDGGCNDEINLRRNISDLDEVHLKPIYLSQYPGADLSVELFGKNYAVPVGIAPVGLQGLMWPNAPVILAKAAVKHELPFVISTVSTASIEEIGELTEGRAWFQLYHPATDALRDDLLRRAEDVGMDVLIVTADVPTFGYRPREFKSRLAMPPKMTFKNILQIMGKPRWAIETLRYGRPAFRTVMKYMPEGMGMRELGLFMKDNFDGRMNPDKLAALRDRWNGKIVLKGLASEEDAEMCIKLGFDGMVISNHGGRQLDAAESSIQTLKRLAPQFGDKITIMMDGGLRSGPDIARAIACGAKFTFMGRAWMYGVAALGAKGGDHTASILKLQYQQVMEQLGCQHSDGLPSRLLDC